jgi:hypothetical protein
MNQCLTDLQQNPTEERAHLDPLPGVRLVGRDARGNHELPTKKNNAAEKQNITIYIYILEI